MSAIKVATKAAEQAFSEYLIASRSTASSYVPPCVVDAAEQAYREAGGTGSVEVVGHGNTTHPVCSVTVQRKRS